MPKFDLAGNPLPEPQSSPSSSPPAGGQPPSRYDLAGNPLPSAPASTPAEPVSPLPAAAPRPAGGLNPNAGLTFASRPADYVDTTPLKKLQPSQWLLGTGVAGLVGILGAIGIEKILFYSHFGFAVLYVVLGAAISGTLRAFTGRGGQAMALTAAGITIVCLGVCHLVYVQDVLEAARKEGDAGGVTFSEMLPLALGRLKMTHWLLVLGSVMVSLLSANKESKAGF